MSAWAAGVRLRPRPASPARAMLPAVVRLAPLVVLVFAVGVIAQPGAALVRDEPDLIAAAERLLRGELVGIDQPRLYLWHGPGLVALLAPFVALDVPIWAIRLLEPLLLAAALVLFHRLLRRRLAPGPALAWTYALALYVPLYNALGTVQKEPLAILLVVAGMLALTHGLATGRRSALAGAGLALAALAMVRLEYGWVALALLAAAGVRWSLRRRCPAARGLVVAAAVAVLACVPWLAFTYRETGQPLYWSSSAGLSLFWMSPTLPGENGQWHSPRKVPREPALAPYRPLFERLGTLHPLRADLELRRLAAEHVRRHPLLYARNVAANASRLFFFAPMNSPRTARTLIAHAVANGLLLAALAVAGRRLWRRRRALPPETAPLALFAALAVAVHLPASASPRMLLPVVPVLLWLVAQAMAGGRRI